jgi:outer membrane protein assembly factor BamD
MIGLAGCSSDKDEIMADKPVEEIYNIAMDHYEQGRYERAAKTFAEVERQHPYSNWAVKAQLMSAYAYYESKRYDDAIEGFNVFIQLHPGHPDVAYAYYMLGLCYYEQVAMVERDQKATELSLKSFSEVLTRFPGSPYAKDAKLKINLLYTHLAGKEMEIGRFYLKRHSYLPALNRFKMVIEQYQTTAQVPEALHRAVECYLALGILDQAQAMAAILGHNYPGSQWYADSYALIQAALPQGHDQKPIKSEKKEIPAPTDAEPTAE